MEFKVLETNASQQEVARKLVTISAFNPEESDALYTGNLGKIVSLLTLSHYYHDSTFEVQAVKAVQSIIERIGEDKGVKFTTAMSNGLSGLGYALLLLQKQELLTRDGNTQLLLDWIAKNVFEKAKIEIGEGDLDPLYSSMGGLYFLTKYASLHPLGFDYVEELVQLLSTKVEENTHGKYIANKRYQKEGTYFINTGLAHGICGMILVLVEISKTGNPDSVNGLIKLLLDFLKSLYKPYKSSEENFLFPRSVTVDGNAISQARKYNSNIGWCTSDLSIVYAFLKAGCVLKDNEISEFGNSLLSDFLKFEQSNLPIQEANFCHGYSGFSWLFKKCYDLTQRKECLLKSQYWLSRALVSEYTAGENNLLNGNQGVYNVILRSTDMSDSLWDEVFFL